MTTDEPYTIKISPALKKSLDDCFDTLRCILSNVCDKAETIVLPAYKKLATIPRKELLIMSPAEYAALVDPHADSFKNILKLRNAVDNLGVFLRSDFKPGYTPVNPGKLLSELRNYAQEYQGIGDWGADHSLQAVFAKHGKEIEQIIRSTKPDSQRSMP